MLTAFKKSNKATYYSPYGSPDVFFTPMASPASLTTPPAKRTRRSPAKTPGGIVIGGTEWVLTKRLGGGTFGDVFLAHAADIPTVKAAVKTFRKKDASVKEDTIIMQNDSFVEEALTANLIAAGWVGGPSGPVRYFVPVIGTVPADPESVDIDNYRGPLYIAYKLAWGSLKDWRKEYEPDKEIVDTAFSSLMNGLQEMQDLGYAHRDIKPDNILVYEDDNAPGGWSFTFGDLGSVCGPGTANVECDGNNRTTFAYVPYQSKPNEMDNGSAIANDVYETPEEAMWTDMYGLACCLHYLITEKDLCNDSFNRWFNDCANGSGCDRVAMDLGEYPREMKAYKKTIGKMLNMSFEEFMAA